MSRIRDIAGQRFGRLVALSRQISTTRESRWTCLCDCGKQTEVDLSNLRNGTTKSCGCYGSESSSKRMTIHGKHNTKVYIAWRNMRRRCSNPKDRDWENYGGRGVRVCERWRSFENFYADMGDPPKGTSLDRINTDGDYEPSNCRWATYVAQVRNRRNTLLVSYKGETKTMQEWSEELGVRYGTLSQRLNKYKWSVEMAFETPVTPNGRGHTAKRHPERGVPAA